MGSLAGHLLSQGIRRRRVRRTERLQEGVEGYRSFRLITTPGGHAEPLVPGFQGHFLRQTRLADPWLSHQHHEPAILTGHGIDQRQDAASLMLAPNQWARRKRTQEAAQLRRSSLASRASGCVDFPARRHLKLTALPGREIKRVDQRFHRIPARYVPNIALQVANRTHTQIRALRQTLLGHGGSTAVTSQEVSEAGCFDYFHGTLPMRPCGDHGPQLRAA